MSNSAFQKTSDYSQFKFLIENRSTSRSHINSLKAAIKSHPDILEVQPILVNNNKEIIDGQHRFTAASELGLPITYVEVPGIGIEVARAMNILQRKWTPDDYAKSYAKTGNVNYVIYMNLREKYPKIPHSTLIVYMAGRHQHGISTLFRKGLLEVQDEFEARQNLDKLMEVSQYIDFHINSPLAYALLQLLNNDDFNYEDFLAKLKLFGDRVLHRSTVISDYLRMFEDLYNFNRKSERVRLF